MYREILQAAGAKLQRLFSQSRSPGYRSRHAGFIPAISVFFFLLIRKICLLCLIIGENAVGNGCGAAFSVAGCDRPFVFLYIGNEAHFAECGRKTVIARHGKLLISIGTFIAVQFRSNRRGNALGKQFSGFGRIESQITAYLLRVGAGRDGILMNGNSKVGIGVV